MPKKKKVKFTDSVKLPFENSEMESYVIENKAKIYLSIVNMIEEAVDSSCQAIEAFRFENSDYVVMVREQDFKENLDFIVNELEDMKEPDILDKAMSVKRKVDNITDGFMTNYFKL